jgi:pimeloyl-ACP methyl ester carboxylesterase
VRRELAGLEDGAVVVGHSLGGTILINTLTEQPQPQPQPLLQSPLESPSPSPSHSQPESPSHSESESDSESRNSGAVRRGSEQNEPARLSAIVLIAAPFIGEGGWPSEEFQLSGDLGVRLPKGAQVHVFHGLLDETAPPSHAELYAGVIPSARLHLLPARDHQLNNDLSEVAKVISPFVRR